ncbi:uncharacterized protein LOC133198257 [Saccostrea echinata]|uniref:uncharacterized protein LOC133198257 n=1 Tax=Saccostrea echinata TaxID=191078 RepID=UPI002A81CBBE|nr:uncharacterized protein LOC133198257 [Saccostrea echinata]
MTPGGRAGHNRLGSNGETGERKKSDDRNFQGQDIVRCYKCDEEVRFLCIPCKTKVCKACVGDHLETKGSPRFHNFAFYGVDDREISSQPNVEGIVDNDENLKDTWSIALLPDLAESQRIIVCNDQSIVLYQKQRDGDWSNKELKRINGNSFIRCIATFNSRILYSATNCKKVYETDEQFSTEAIRPYFTSEADGWTPRGIAFSFLNPGHVWIGLYHAQTKKGKVIKVQSEGKFVGYLGDEGDRKPYTNPRFLAENRNGDICIADGVSKKVFALSPKGNVCFSYKPSGIISGYGARTVATDKKCNILVAYPNDGIHVLNSIGNCLLILKEVAYPTACCVSLKDSLFVCSKDGDIKEITYLMPPSPTNQ